jgi:hypothetical protein
LDRVRRRNPPLNCEALEGRQFLSGYYLVNELSDQVLDDPYSYIGNGAAIQQNPLHGQFSQRWDLVPVGNGNYFIRNEASQLVLDNGLSTSDGTYIGQWQSYGGLNQQWQFWQKPDGNFAIQNAYSHLVLGDPGSSVHNGTPIDQLQWNGGANYGGDNEEWTLLAAGDAPAVTCNVVNAASGDVLVQFPLGGLLTFVPLADCNFLIVD